MSLALPDPFYCLPDPLLMWGCIVIVAYLLHALWCVLRRQW